MKDYLDFSDGDDKFQTRFKVSKTSKVNQLIGESKFGDALTLINEILKNDYSEDNLVLKGKILDNLSRYSEAVECFDKALNFSQSGEIKILKADTLYHWAKVTYFPDGDYEKALNLIDEALKTSPDLVDLSEYYFLKAEILESSASVVEAKKYYLKAYGEFEKADELEKQADYLNDNKDCLINITGGHFYNFTPKSGLIVDLVRELDNEHDSDAVAVYFDNEKIGYVANSSYTLIDNLKSASDIKDKVSNDSKAEILFIFLDEYVIAKCLF